MKNPIPVATTIFEKLYLNRWNELSKSDQAEVAEHLEDRLVAAGWKLGEPTVEEFGPLRQLLLVLQFQDPTTGLRYSLIPGGAFQPGLSENLQPRYKELYMQMEGWEATEERDTDEQPWRPEPLEETWTFASEQSCDLRPKPSVQLSPFLMATGLVTGKVPGLRKVLGHLTPYCEREFERSLREGYPVGVRWEKVAAIVERFSWSLPTTEEFEWALRGDIDSIFYWGNDFPDFILVEYIEPFETGVEAESEAAEERFSRSFRDLMTGQFDDIQEPAWPRCNRFGLTCMLACGTWCQPSEKPGEKFPLIVRGGAADCWGWQGCGEWKRLLNASETRLGISSDYADHHAIRPVIRIRPDENPP